MTFCGYIALVGRPNVGKSTLLNRLLGTKLSITSRRPQTTRHRILGVHSEPEYQFVFVDTPGIHQTEQKAMNRLMNKAAFSSLHDVDAVVFMTEGTSFNDDDRFVLEKLQKLHCPLIWVINKIDKLASRDLLLPLIDKHQRDASFHSIIALSAKTGKGLDILWDTLRPLLPEGPKLFPDDQLTDRPIRFLCAEMVREKIFRLCGQELPYATDVTIESYQDEGNLVRIHVLITVEKEGHKRIIIGDKGQKLKDIATAARLDMERLLGKKVFLQCWCKIKSGWSDNERMLRNLGYDE